MTINTVHANHLHRLASFSVICINRVNQSFFCCNNYALLLSLTYFTLSLQDLESEGNGPIGEDGDELPAVVISGQPEVTDPLSYMVQAEPVQGAGRLDTDDNMELQSPPMEIQQPETGSRNSSSCMGIAGTCTIILFAAGRLINYQAFQVTVPFMYNFQSLSNKFHAIF